MGKKLKLTVTKEWTPDPYSYRDVEWPEGTPPRDLATLEDMAAYEQSRLDQGDVSVNDILDTEDQNMVCKVEVVDDTAATVGNPFLTPEPQDNPFTDKNEAPNAPGGAEDEPTKY